MWGNKEVPQVSMIYITRQAKGYFSGVQLKTKQVCFPLNPLSFLEEWRQEKGVEEGASNKDNTRGEEERQCKVNISAATSPPEKIESDVKLKKIQFYIAHRIYNKNILDATKLLLILSLAINLYSSSLSASWFLQFQF